MAAVVIIDANVLLYAVDRSSAHHERARSWLDSAWAGSEAVGLAWVALLAFSGSVAGVRHRLPG